MSREEAESSFRRYDFFLNELDANHNGVLETDEVSGSKRYLADRMLQRAGLETNYPVAVSRVREGLQQYYVSRVSGGVAPGTTFMTAGATMTTPLPPGVPPGMPPGAPPPAGSSTSLLAPALSAASLVPGFGPSANVPLVPGFGDASRSLVVATRAMSSSASSATSSRSSPPGPAGPPPPSSSSSSSSSRSEDEAKYAQYAKGLLQQFDKNKNGALEQEEWSEMKKGTRTLLGDMQENDTNRDGKISLDELTPALIRYSRGRSHGSGSGTALASGGSDSQKSYRFGTTVERLLAGLPSEFVQQDANHDGQVSLAEFLAGERTEAKAARFAEYDLNGDGFITPDEWQAVTKQKEKQKKEGDKGREFGRRGGPPR
jgi:Ca2+-binding EF-hand superfamily protein